MPNFATLVWECPTGADHDEIHGLVLMALTAAGIKKLLAPLGQNASTPDGSAMVFRYANGAQLDTTISNIASLSISFFLTTSQVGNTNDCSDDVDRDAMEEVTG